MRQQDLFEDDRYRPPARRTDPDTSHEGAAHIAPTVGHLRDLMLCAFEVRPMTANEAVQYVIGNLGGDNSESLRKRVHELERDRRIWSYRKRECLVTGRRCKVYEVRR